MLAAQGEAYAAAERLYLMCYSRKPSPEEATAIRNRLSVAGDPKAELSDLFWALLNSNEFLFNH